MSKDKIDDLIGQLSGSDFNVRLNAVDAFIEIGKPAVPALIEALKDGDDVVRMIAAEALGGIDDVRAVPALIDLLKDKNWYMREGAAGALGKIAKKNPGNAEVIRAVPALIDALKDENEYVRLDAAQALERSIPSLTDIHLGEIGKAERVAWEVLEKAEGTEKKKLLSLLEKINKKRNEILEPEAKKLKPPKRIKRKGKPRKKIWRAAQ